MSSNQNIITNFKDSYGVDLGSKLVRKDYLLSVYGELAPILNPTPQLLTWGMNDNGQLGANLLGTSYDVPQTPVSGNIYGWKEVSCGSDHTAAIKTDGSLWVWGVNSNGKLGTNNITNTPTPVTTFTGGNNWKFVSCGDTNTAAIKTDGSLWVWGGNGSGQLGTNDSSTRSTPVTTFAGGNNWKQVSCGYDHTAAIKTDGSLWVWGSGSNGRLGTNDITGRLTPVTTFAGGNNWKQIKTHIGSAAIKNDGSLWAWGPWGILGNELVQDKSTPVTTFAGGNDWKQVSTHTYNTAAIKTDGSLWVWGFGAQGVLGTNNSSTRVTPATTFAGGNNWKQVSCGFQYMTAIKTDGSLWGWGYANRGQLGTADTISRSTPVTTFAGGNDWKQVSSGDDFTSAIKSFDYI
jgi:alpha-tubulin suppressor-like RCC1 family protein